MKDIKIDLLDIDGFHTLKLKSSGIYLVGGAVRDLFLKKESKDIDILVCGLYYDQIVNILSNYGEINEVGKSFGVLKYKPKNWDKSPIDISIPRRDIKDGDGHKGFRIEVDPFLTIESELSRRDFTINSMAISLDGKLIDPFNGKSDLLNKLIKATSQKAFSEDPLRMLRAIQFSSRFDFKISKDTWGMILDNKEQIKLISGERIIEELDKVFFKGDIKLGIELFIDSGLHEQLFGIKNLDIKYDNIKTREDFYFSICENSDSFKTVLKGDNDTEKGIKSIKKCITNNTEISKVRQSIFDSIQISKSVLNSGIVESLYGVDVIQEFKSGSLPNSVNDLAVNGFDLMELGFSGSKISERQKFLLSEIFSNKRSNTKSDLILNC